LQPIILSIGGWVYAVLPLTCHQCSRHLTTTTTEVPCFGLITNGMQTRLHVFSSPTAAPTLLKWPCQEQPWVRLNRLCTSVRHFCSSLHKLAMAPSAACEYGAEEQTVYHVVLQCLIINLPMDCTAWWFWMIKQLTGCSTPAPRSNAAKQWIWTTRSTDEEECSIYYEGSYMAHSASKWGLALSNEYTRTNHDTPKIIFCIWKASINEIELNQICHQTAGT